MDFKTLSEFIAGVGFPIAAYFFLAKYFAKRDEKNEKDLDKMRETVDNNTKALQELQHGYDSIKYTIDNVNRVMTELLSYLQRGDK